MESYLNKDISKPLGKIIFWLLLLVFIIVWFGFITLGFYFGLGLECSPQILCGIDPLLIASIGITFGLILLFVIFKLKNRFPSKINYILTTIIIALVWIIFIYPAYGLNSSPPNFFSLF